MTIRYVKMYSFSTDLLVGIFDREKQAVIPISQANSDYQKYLQWIEDGNIAEETTPYAAE